MANRPQQRDVQRIADVRAPWCVTIYGDANSWLRGNHPNANAEAQIRSSMDGLRIAGAPTDITDAIRDHLDSLSAWSPKDSAGVDRRAVSVGVFATENGAEMFSLTTSPSPWVGVADRFLVGPLLAGALDLVPPVFVLAISETQVRLVDVTAPMAEVVEVPGIPLDLESTVALDLTGDRNTLAHLRTSEDPKGRLREYARAVDRAVEPVLRQSGATLIIAAAQPLASIYRSTTVHGDVVPATLAGNHDADPNQELADRAAPILKLHRRAVLEARLTRFGEMPDRDLVLTDFDDIASAARDGAIETLFVDTERRMPVEGEAFEGRTSIDRVDEIIRRTLSSDANVIPVRPDDLPTASPVAAVLRYKRAGHPGTSAR